MIRHPYIRRVSIAYWRLVAILLLAALILPAPSVHGADVDFERDVAPLLQAKCIRCHKPGNAKGEVSLTTVDDILAGGHLVAGKPEESYLLELVTAEAEGKRPAMPKEGDPLTDEDLAVLKKWIASGANWPEKVVLREQSKADRSWWSLQPLGDTAPSDVAQAPAAWRENPIDRFVYARLAENNLAPNPPADEQAIIRRATYDLTGLPPTPEEVRRFLADDSPQAYEKLIDRLLASPHYGERWGRHWLDVVRFGESRGFERNEIINNAWPFRDYVIQSLNDDKPFNQMVREHLAGDLIGKNDPAIEAGSIFLVCGPYDDVGNQDPQQAAQIRANTIDEIIRAASEAFLGLTTGCARCHDHKFDPILQQDYYSLYATFAGVYHGQRVIATQQQQQQRVEQLKPLEESRSRIQEQINELEKTLTERGQANAPNMEKLWVRLAIQRSGVEERFDPIQAGFVRLVVEGAENNPHAVAGYGIDEFEVFAADSERNVALASAGAKANGPSRVANDFADAYSAELTIDGRFGARWLAAGPTLTIELAQLETISRVMFSSDRKGDAGDHHVAAFVSEYRIEVSEDGEQWTQVANSRDRAPVNEAHRNKRLVDAVITAEEQEKLAGLRTDLGEVTQQINAIPGLPIWWAGNFNQPEGAFHIFVGGDPQKKGAQVTPASLSPLAEVTEPYQLDEGAPEAERRLALADWIVHRDNPLTPRVLANRVWHYHFGAGIVDTPSDFGYMGGRPSHPELLDWLASQLHRHDWRLKALHKQIMLSQTYRQSADYRSGAAEKDGDSRLLWRFPPRRLTAEEVRDGVLHVSGQLNTTMGGPGFRLYEYLQDNVATYVPLDEHPPHTWRRAVYHQNARATRVDLMSDFDCPDNSFAAPRRTETTTPLQALAMLNHSFCLTMAEQFARRLEEESAAVAGGVEKRTHQIERAFWLAYSRAPDEDELAAASELVEQHGLRALCRAVLNSNELIYLQ